MSQPLYRQEIPQDETDNTRNSGSRRASSRNADIFGANSASSRGNARPSMNSRQSSTASARPNSEAPTSPRITRRSSQQSEGPPSPLARRGSHQSSGPRRRAPGNRAGRRLGTSDLRNKQCFICYSTEAEDTADSSRWIHACSCSLLAHEDCLLHWISEAQSRSSAPGPAFSRPVKCPQCSTPYQLMQPSSPFLAIYDYFDARLDSLAVRSAICLGVAGIGISSGVYGVYASKIFLGKHEANRILAKAWPWSYYLNFPLIAPLLILCRTTILDTLLPVMPLSLITLSPISNSAHTALSFLSSVPTAASTVILLPWVRLLYNSCRSRIFRYCLPDRNSSTTPAGILRITRQHIEDAPQDLPQQPGEAQAQGPIQGQQINAALTLSVHVLSRMIVGALLFPFISAASGSLLLYIARRTGWKKLRNCLGLESDLLWRAALDVQNEPLSSTWTRWAGLGATKIRSSSNDVRDPVWYRNALGGGLFVLVKDTLLLAKRIGEARRRRSRRIREVHIDQSLNLDFLGDDWRSANA